mmetsp:Transcript_32637/g.75127  ORF Transcript_32637/g.75127 Transcript_32637/m.75127 type:complete len:156 (-) Transcript_32637:61-528(-)
MGRILEFAWQHYILQKNHSFSSIILLLSTLSSTPTKNPLTKNKTKINSRHWRILLRPLAKLYIQSHKLPQHPSPVVQETKHNQITNYLQGDQLPTPQIPIFLERPNVIYPTKFSSPGSTHILSFTSLQNTQIKPSRYELNKKKAARYNIDHISPR